MSARLVRIDSATAPELAAYNAIRERDLVGREGSFIAEGEVVVRVLVASGRPIRSLLLEARRVAAMQDVIAALPEEVPTYVVSQAVMDGVAGFSIHRGILAIGARGQSPAPSELIGAGGSLVVLVGLTNHDNVGGIFRNAAAFGASGVLLDPSTCDPFYRKAIRVSAGAALTVPFARMETDHVLTALERAKVPAIALTPSGEETLSEVAGSLRGRPHALFFGTEGTGLPEDVLARTRRTRIAMAPGFDSLNVAATSAVALYEMTKR